MSTADDLTFFGFRYYVAEPNQFLAVTGSGITSVEIHKKYMKKPFQRINILDVTPRNYEFQLHAMSNEKMEFLLPAVFTIGPKIHTNDEIETRVELHKYAIFLANADKSLDVLIKGIIEGEVRVLAAAMSIEEIFKGRAQFKRQIVDNIQKELDQFGLKVYNSNIKELSDAVGSEYFTYIRQRTRESAINTSKVEVAEARLRGTTGEKEREGKTRQAVSEVESATVMYENTRKKSIAESNTALTIAKAEFDKRIGLAELEKAKAIEQRDFELSVAVEQVKQKQNTEKLRAKQMAEAQVQSETITKLAEANATKVKIEADAYLYAEKQKALGALAQYEAQANGFNQLVRSFGGDTKAVINYMMIEKGVYKTLAEQTSKAITGLSPKITVWNTGSSNGNDSMQPIRDLFKSLPPMLQTIHEQTGITAPSWLVNMPPKSDKDASAIPAASHGTGKDDVSDIFFQKN